MCISECPSTNEDLKRGFPYSTACPSSQDLTAWKILVFMSPSMHSHERGCMCVWVDTGCLLDCSPLHLWSQDLSLTPELNDSSSSSWPAYPRILLPFSPSCWDCRQLAYLGGFYMGSGGLYSESIASRLSTETTSSSRIERSCLWERAVFSMTPKHVSAYFVNRGITPCIS